MPVSNRSEDFWPDHFADVSEMIRMPKKYTEEQKSENVTKSSKSNQALTIWTAVPADIRTKILSNVFCGQCRVVVTIADYSVELVRPDIVLRSFCATCGHKVARVVEGLGLTAKKTTSKPKKPNVLEYYIFSV